jgi:cell division protein FtsB
VQARSSSKTTSVIGRLGSIPKPTLKQAGTVLVLLLVIVLAVSRIIGLISELHEVRATRIELDAKRMTLEKRHSELENQAQFVSNPDNLEIELRSRFNYKKPGENVIVVVPPKDASSTTTTHE